MTDREDLAAIIDGVRTAPPLTIITAYRQPLAAHGADGIQALAPVLLDSERQFAACALIRLLAANGPAEQLAACDVLIGALEEVRPAAQKYLDKTARQVGCVVGSVSFKPGTRFTPVYEGVTAHHVIVDEIAQPSGAPERYYLSACRWVFFESTLRKYGGLLFDVPEPCLPCRRILADDRA